MRLDLLNWVKFYSMSVEHIEPNTVNSRCFMLGKCHWFLVHLAGVQAVLKIAIGAEKGWLRHLPNTLWVGSFASFLMSASLQGGSVYLCLLPIPAMWFPCGSLELHWDDSPGPLEKKGVLSLLGIGDGGEVKEAVSVTYWTRRGDPWPCLDLYSLLYVRWSERSQFPPSAQSKWCIGVFACCGVVHVISVTLVIQIY